jgi:hypothetical protein
MQYLIMPATILGLESIAGISRYMRASVLEVLRLDYVTTARAKGLGRSVVLSRHVLRNALLPIITIIGLRLPGLLGGALIIETMFNWPGMGILYIDGVNTRDYPLIMGMTLVSAITIVISNLITDVAYSFADPRIRYESTGMSGLYYGCQTKYLFGGGDRGECYAERTLAGVAALFASSDGGGQCALSGADDPGDLSIGAAGDAQRSRSD